MRATEARLLARLYPRAWRERYGAEFRALLEAEDGGPGMWADVVWSAVREHVLRTSGGSMDIQRNTFGSVMRQPSAFLPVAMSVIALGMVLGAVAWSGAQHGSDEGTVAHLWQILMGAQVPIVLWFAIRGLRRAPGPVLGVLAVQAGAGLASMAPVFFLGLG